MFKVWLITYDMAAFRPTHWQDNPESGLAFMPISDYIGIWNARSIAMGFNDREIEQPFGKWAIVCIQGQEPPPGARVVLRSRNELQPSEN